MEAKTHVSAYLPKRLKRRLKDIAEDKNMKMNDFMIQAIRNEIDRYDASFAAPDLVLNRISELINSQIAVVAVVDKQSQALKDLVAEIEDLKALVNTHER